MARKSSIDWAAVEADFRAGGQSNRQLSEKHGVAESSIRKRIKAEGWVRTNASKVRTKPQSAHQPARTMPAAPAKQASIPRKSADHPLNDRISALASRLMGELEDATAYLGEIADAIEDETAEDRSTRRKQAMLKAISTRERTETLRTLKQIDMMESGKAGKKGVKEERKEAAEKAAKGRFARMPSPKLVVNNGK